MTNIGKAIISIVILLFGIGAAAVLIHSRDEPEPVAVERIVPVVEVLRVEREDVRVQVPSQGMVRPLRQTRISSEVGGKVVAMDDGFEVGGYVGEGVVLVRIDSADYEAALAQAEAELANANLMLETELAQAAQAERDWRRLGGDGEASPLVLRAPQVASVRARMDSAEAVVNKARRDLERTLIRTPYAGRILDRSVDLGALVSPGAGIAELASVGKYEVYLPVSVDEVPLIELRGEDRTEVIFEARVGGETYRWVGDIVRSSGQVDRAARSVHLVALVDAEDETNAGMEEMWMPGFFVQATIRGRVLEGVIRVPRSALSEGNRVLVIDEDNLLRFRHVEIVHGNLDEVFIIDGLEGGELVCLTRLSGVIDGQTRVEPVVGDESAGRISGSLPSPR